MKYAVQIRPEAEQDLEDAAIWYEQQQLTLGHDFLDAIDSEFQRIASSPMMYPVVHRETRRAIIQRFPFSIFYRIEDNVILVIAILHGSRNPQSWKNRT